MKVLMKQNRKLSLSLDETVDLEAGKEYDLQSEIALSYVVLGIASRVEEIDIDELIEEPKEEAQEIEEGEYVLGAEEVSIEEVKVEVDGKTDSKKRSKGKKANKRA